jgi:hypothetical protein
LNSEKASPLGTFTAYLSCAEMVKLPTTARHTAIPIVSTLLRTLSNTALKSFLLDMRAACT